MSDCTPDVTVQVVGSPEIAAGIGLTASVEATTGTTVEVDAPLVCTATVELVGGIPGPPGGPGPVGPAGPPGPPGGGSTIHTGSGLPTAAIGGIGDYYVDTVGDDLYGPKTSDAAPWPLAMETVVVPADTYTHVQSVPAAVWTIAHGLDFPPNITIVDSAGNQVEGDITFLPGEAIASFSVAFAGRAFCS